MKKYILAIFLTILIIPSVVSAAWWNPFSWFNFSFFQKVETSQSIISTTTAPSNIFDTSKEKLIENKIIDKTPKETPVYLKETISDSASEDIKVDNIQSNTSVESNIQVATTTIDLYAKYRDPKTGEIMSPKEYADYIANKLKKQQKSNEDNDPYKVLSESGNAYSPEQLNAIDCAYYGRNCNTFTPTQNSETYQNTSPTIQPQSVNCSNYKIEMNNLLQSASNRGTLFSGADAQKQSALKAKYPGCY
jgi:hypothetical protein